MNKAEKINFCISNVNHLETPVSQSQIKSANVAELDMWVEEINTKLSSSEDDDNVSDDNQYDNTGVNDTLEIKTVNVTTEMGKIIPVKVVMLKFVKFSNSGNLKFDYNGKTLTASTRLAITDLVSFEMEHKGSLFPIKLESISKIIDPRYSRYGETLSGQILEPACEQFQELIEQSRLSALREQQRRQNAKKAKENKSVAEKQLIDNYNTVVGAKTGLESMGLEVDTSLLALIINKQ